MDRVEAWREGYPDGHAAWLRERAAAHRVTNADVAAAVRDVCEGRVDSKDIHALEPGHESVAYEISRPKGTVIARAKMSDRPQYEGELWARRAALAAGVPAVEILGIRHYPREGRWLSVCVERKAEGELLKDVLWADGFEHPRSVRLLRHLGELLARLHTVRPVGFGRLDGQGVGPYDTYGAYLTAQLNDAVVRTLLTLDRRGRKTVEDAHAAVLANLSSLEPTRPTLLHADVLPQHCFVSGDQITGIIDMEETESGHPIFEFAYWDRRGFPTRELFQGYEQGGGQISRGDFLPTLQLCRLTRILELDYWTVHQRSSLATEAVTRLETDLRRVSNHPRGSAPSPSSSPPAQPRKTATLPGTVAPQPPL